MIMWNYIVRRLLVLIPSLLLIYTLIFGLIQATPGGPWDRRVGSKPTMPEEIRERLNEKYHLNDPIHVQYVRYLWDLLHGDLGYSYYQKARAVSDIIRDFLPVSIQLGGTAWLITNVFGITIGVVSALKQNSWLDRISSILGIAAISIPAYVGTTLLILILAVKLRLVPTGGWNGIFSRTALIPILALAIMPSGYLIRYTRTMMIEVLQAEYIRTARSKGLRERMILLRHALKNALIPVVTMSGMSLAEYVTGTFYIEAIYGIPGLGRYFVSSTARRDYPVLLALFLLYAFVVWLMTFLIDIVYGILDPRVRLT